MLLLFKHLSEKLESLAAEKRLDFSKIAVAVSGGADSLALVLLMAEISKQKGWEVVALTVNHNLRPTSNKEAQYVADVMAKYGVKHHILAWKHEEISTGMEEKARQARYKLLLDWCAENGFCNLMTAHHLKDQAETFLMRLQRGSGVDGLAGIADVSSRQGINLVRPLLEVDPDELRGFLQAEKVEWVEDESNCCDDYLRVRIRKLLPVLEDKLGLSLKRIANTSGAMASVRDYFSQQVRGFIDEEAEFFGGAVVFFVRKNFALLHLEMQVRILSNLIKNISKKDYPPTFEELCRLKKMLENSTFKAASLGGCEIIAMGGKIWIVKKLPDNFEYSKKIWQDFCERNPKYQKIVLPYMAKINLLVEFCQ